MAKKSKHKWASPDWLNESVPSTAWFHDKEVEVYEGTTEIKGISLWRGNYRTLLDLKQLQEVQGKTLKRLTDDDIIEYIFHQGLHKISNLAKSIKINGVRVPLILSCDKELIDGNRRFLACNYLMRKEGEPDPKFTIAPVKCVDPKISDEIKLKIIAEMNFLDPHKEKWPQNVRAQFAIKEFDAALKKLKDEEEAYEYIDYNLEISKTDLLRFKAVFEMIDEYVDYVGEKARQAAEIFVRKKFQFFEEFYNKALSRGKAIKDRKVADLAKKLLYKYLFDKQLTSVTKVRQFAEFVRYKPAIDELKKPNGSFAVAKSIYDDYASPRIASEKIIGFCEWLEGLSASEKNKLSYELKKRLKKAVQKL